jgi:hypothetical protein
MTEPVEIAETATETVPGLWHWSICNSSIGGHVSSSHALLTPEGLVLVDPVRLDGGTLEMLSTPVAALLTAGCHQRSAWRYRREFGAEIWLPDDASKADEQPDHTYVDGQSLPGGGRARRTPGPEWAQYCFLYEGDLGILFCSDLVSADDTGTLHFVDPAFEEDPGATRTSLTTLLELPFDVLCLAHGAPITDDPKAAIRALLELPS